MKIVNVMASSLDGKIAAATIESDEAREKYGMTSAADRKHLIAQLRSADAVITGANSVRSSDTLWDLRNHKGKYPAWFVYSNSGIESKFGFWKQTKVERTIVTSNPGIELFDQNVTRMVFDQAQIVLGLVEYLKEQKFEKVLLFGGGEINQLFYSEGVVDILVLTLCPTLLSTPSSVSLVEETLSTPVRLQLSDLRKVENHLFLTYNIKDH